MNLKQRQGMLALTIQRQLVNELGISEVMTNRDAHFICEKYGSPKNKFDRLSSLRNQDVVRRIDLCVYLARSLMPNAKSRNPLR